MLLVSFNERPFLKWNVVDFWNESVPGLVNQVFLLELQLLGPS